MDWSEIGAVASYAGSSTALLLAVAIGWIAFKTRSWHPIRYRLWLLVNGKSKVEDETVARALQNEADLTAFRFLAMDTESIHSAKRLIAWVNAKQISLSMLSACGGYFSQKDMTLNTRLPRKRPRTIVVGVTGAVGACAVLFVVFGMATSSAILRFKDSGQWFLLAPHEARTLFVKNPSPATDAACKSASGISGSSFIPSDEKVLCRIFADPKLATYVSDTVRQQRLAFGLLLAVLFYVWSQVYGGLLRLRAAWRLKEHLHESAAA